MVYGAWLIITWGVSFIAPPEKFLYPEAINQSKIDVQEIYFLSLLKCYGTETIKCIFQSWTFLIMKTDTINYSKKLV